MKAKGFKIIDQPQYFYKKSEGFRFLEKKAKDGKLYYFTGEYAFGENWSEYEKMTFEDFKKNYEEVVGVVSAENTFF